MSDLAQRIELILGDITSRKPTRSSTPPTRLLLGGGGVDGAIHRRGGPVILEECRRLGGCATGDAKITTGGRLKARHVIHTVGPVYRDGRHGEPDLLASAYRRSLEVASKNGLRTIAFPSISTGAYGYPIRDAARVALRTVADYLRTPATSSWCASRLFSADDLAVYQDAAREIL